jgi:exopolyphosphatase / guanosine-5'-triphosphate,3'-diphosphate pyrophosphatase
VDVPQIVPRWEWRTFGEGFGAADATFAALTPERVEESDETYLLSEAGGDTVKVRADLMDVKHLERVNDDGLEQWAPVMKAPFPLPAVEVASVLTGLRVDPPPPLARSAYTLAELLNEVVRPTDDLLAVEVHKRRHRYTIGGCMVELTDVATERASTRTIAVEAEDATRVIATVRELGLDSRSNVSFPRGLKELVLFGAGRYAVIDVGTNSVKFHIGERDAGGAWRTLVDGAEVTRLGEGLEQTGRLGADAMGRTIDAIDGMADEAGSYRVQSIAAVGTAGLRVASNAPEFVAAVQERCGVTVEIISGEEEGRLAYLAAISELGVAGGSLVVFDSGGGSSEFTFGHGGDVDERFSVDVGAVRLTERYGLDEAVPDDMLAEAREAIARDLSGLDGRATPDATVGIGGTVTNLAAVAHGLATYDPDVVQGSALDRNEVDRQIELYRMRGADERRSIVGLQPERAGIILAGACIVRTVIEKLGVESLTVSDRGLRHGLLVDRFG